MRQTLFTIPSHVPGLDIPLFGFGLLLAIWAVVSVVVVAWSWKQRGFDAQTQGYLPVLGLIGVIIAFVLPSMAGNVGLPIRGFGLMLLLAISASFGLAIRRARQMGFHPDVVYSMAFWLVVPGIIGARLFYIIQYWESFQRPSLTETLLALANVTQGGLVVYGSLLAGAAGFFTFVYRYRLPTLPMMDLVAPSLAIGMSLGRIGCFLNGCCYGGACDLPWAVTFPWESPPHMRQVQEGQLYLHGIQIVGDARAPAVITAVEPGSAAAKQGIKAGKRIVAIGDSESDAMYTVATVDHAKGALLAIDHPGQTVKAQLAGESKPRTWRVSDPLPRSLPVHPAQIYSAIDGLLICFFLLAYYPFRRTDGEVAAWLLTIYPITRFLMEIIRTDERGMFGTGLSISQIVSLLILFAAALFWLYLFRRPRVAVAT